MEQESFSRMLMRLDEQKLNKVALKFSNQKNISMFEDHCLNSLVNCKYDLVSSSMEFKENYEVLVHLD